MIEGIDISNHQTSADFGKIKASGRQFCIHKCSEANDFVDRFLRPRWDQMAAAGLKRGAYHFARPSACSSASEAAFFVSLMKDLLSNGDVVVLDMEDEKFPAGRSVSPWTLDWCARVTQALGVKPMIYTYPYYVSERLLTHPDLAQYPLWWASYQPTMRPVPAPWNEAAIWQYTSDGRVPGLGGDIDLNRLLSDDIDDFTRLGLGGMSAASYDWTGVITGKAHWGGDPLRVYRMHERLHRADDGFDLTGLTLDEWETASQANGQLVIDGESG